MTGGQLLTQKFSAQQRGWEKLAVHTAQSSLTSRLHMTLGLYKTSDIPVARTQKVLVTIVSSSRYPIDFDIAIGSTLVNDIRAVARLVLWIACLSRNAHSVALSLPASEEFVKQLQLLSKPTWGPLLNNPELPDGPGPVTLSLASPLEGVAGLIDLFMRNTRRLEELEIIALDSDTPKTLPIRDATPTLKTLKVSAEIVAKMRIQSTHLKHLHIIRAAHRDSDGTAHHRAGVSSILLHDNIQIKAADPFNLSPHNARIRCLEYTGSADVPRGCRWHCRLLDLRRCKAEQLHCDSDAVLLRESWADHLSGRFTYTRVARVIVPRMKHVRRHIDALRRRFPGALVLQVATPHGDEVVTLFPSNHVPLIPHEFRPLLAAMGLVSGNRGIDADAALAAVPDDGLWDYMASIVGQLVRDR